MEVSQALKLVESFFARSTADVKKKIAPQDLDIDLYQEVISALWSEEGTVRLLKC